MFSMSNTNNKKSLFYRTTHHLSTIRRHRKEVRKNCFACGLYKQGLLHDLSKYSLAELKPSITYFTGNKSPYFAEKKDRGYSLGWLHHKGKNKHHWEYWYDMIDGKYTPIEMPVSADCCFSWNLLKRVVTDGTGSLQGASRSTIAGAPFRRPPCTKRIVIPGGRRNAAPATAKL